MYIAHPIQVFVHANHDRVFRNTPMHEIYAATTVLHDDVTAQR